VIEQELRDLAASLFPQEPDLRDAVRGQLVPRRRARMRPLVALAAVLAAALVAALAIPQARSALERWLGIGAERIVHVDTLPPLRHGPALRGRVATRAEADRALGRPLLLPHALAAPDAIRISQEGVALGWGFPARLRITEIVAGYPLLEKLVVAGNRVQRVRVGADRGLWIAGPHAIRFGSDEPEVAGNALVWVHDGVTLRLDGRLGLARALEIARSVRS
jgi:hypothetical protein